MENSIALVHQPYAPGSMGWPSFSSSLFSWFVPLQKRSLLDPRGPLPPESGLETKSRRCPSTSHPTHGPPFPLVNALPSLPNRLRLVSSQTLLPSIPSVNWAATMGMVVDRPHHTPQQVTSLRLQSRSRWLPRLAIDDAVAFLRSSASDCMVGT